MKGGVADKVLRILAGPETESVVMLGGNDQVFHAGGFGHAHPVLGVELGGVELAVELVILVSGDLCAPRPTDLRAFDTDRSPVDEHAETHGLPGVDGGV